MRCSGTRPRPLPSDFAAEVYAVVAEIPPGRLMTYGAVARLVGCPDHARHVGRALAAAPEGVPCHRVVNAAGRTAPGWPGQRSLLAGEGVRFKKNGCADLRTFGWRIDTPEGTVEGL